MLILIWAWATGTVASMANPATAANAKDVMERMIDTSLQLDAIDLKRVVSMIRINALGAFVDPCQVLALIRR